MTITFLGTGTSQGVPVIACGCNVCTSIDFQDKRLRTAVHIEAEGKSIVVDTGPDFRQQMLRERINRVDAVLFTHEHKDHTAGLDDIRSYNFTQDMDMPIYARKSVIDQLKREFSYIFNDQKYPGVPRIDPREIENAPFDIQGLSILPIEVMHYKLPVFGFRIGNFTYITDANKIEEQEMKKLEGSEVLVLNALQIGPHISHFTLAQALEIVERINPRMAYFTHISHKLGKHRDVSKKLPTNAQLAYDGLKISL